MIRKGAGHTNKVHGKRLVSRKKKAIKESTFLKSIYELFIMPLIRIKPLGYTPTEWLEDIFCVETRHIRAYTTKAPFKMPGLYYLAGNLPISIKGPRKVRKGLTIYARYDTTLDRLDVEAPIGPGRKPAVFNLTKSQWKTVRKNLEEKKDE